MSGVAVRFKDVDIIFGDNPASALPLVDAGKSREEIGGATGQVLGVAGANLEVDEGEIVVLMGLSGSGKSTLLRGVNGLNPVIRGSIELRDRAGAMVDVTTCKDTVLRKLRSESVTMVFQQFALLPWRTVADNVGLGLELAGIAKSERDARVNEKLALVGLAGNEDKAVHELSGGMQQRVGLARAFATDAPILLMDEPFSALDPLIRTKLQDELLELQKDLSRTIVFVSHDLDEALKIGNRIAIMEGGHIIQVGTPREIILSPANDYVAEFVAHMNPLAVLRANEIMTPIAEVDDHYDLEGLSITDGTIDASNGGDVIRAGRDTPVNQLMKSRLENTRPVVIEDAGTPVGIVSDREIYSALLGRIGEK